MHLYLLFLYGDNSTSSFIHVFYFKQYLLTRYILLQFELHFISYGCSDVHTWYLNVQIQTSLLTLLFFLDTGSEWSHSLESARSPTYSEQIQHPDRLHTQYII